jgi:predicted PhzF superfamily epimerase YddE/YHI9/ribosomal protein S18 acetylase RimI-like enzyme
MMNNGDSNLLSRVIFRTVQPTDVSRCYQIESASYPEDEAASKSTLQYRQHHAAPFFRCAFLIGDDNGNTSGRTSASSVISYQGRTSFNPTMTLCGNIIGFVCSTRCKSLTADAMKAHDSTGKILSIHSVVVDERYRNLGVASAMLQDYVSAMEKLNTRGNLQVKMEKIVLLAKKNLLAFYVRNGFMAVGVSPVVHGKEQWFELERSFALTEDSDVKTCECYLVDSFADVEKQGSGNPAGVIMLNNPPGQTSSKNGDTDIHGSLDEMEDTENDESKVLDRGAKWMSLVAKELNQSETAFVWPILRLQAALNGDLNQQQNNAESPAYAIRYYTRSGIEVDLCGHATLAASFCVLRRKKIDLKHKISFFAKNDELQAELLVSSASSQSADPMSISDSASRISMSFPWKNVTPIPTEKDRKGVLSMMSQVFFSASASLFGRDQSLVYFTQHVVHIGTTDGNEDLLIELTEEAFDALHGAKVDYRELSSSEIYSRGVIICCCASLHTSSIDFRSRFFGPKVGIDEDPVTGSAHCSLGPYFGNKLGKSVVIGKQESERGGLVECILKQEEGRVCIVGTAVMTVSGQLSIRM